MSYTVGVKQGVSCEQVGRQTLPMAVQGIAEM